MDVKSFLPDNYLELSDFRLVTIHHFVKIDTAVLKHRQQTYIHTEYRRYIDILLNFVLLAFY